MKSFLAFCFYAFLSLLIFGGSVYGYGSILNDFDLQCTGNTEGLFNLLSRSTIQDGIIYLIVSYLLWFLYKWDFPIIKPISIFVGLTLLYGSLTLLWGELNHSYGECGTFGYLLNERGSIVNLFYILPFIFAVLHAVYVGFLYLRFRRSIS